MHYCSLQQNVSRQTGASGFNLQYSFRLLLVFLLHGLILSRSAGSAQHRVELSIKSRKVEAKSLTTELWARVTVGEEWELPAANIALAYNPAAQAEINPGQALAAKP